MDTTPVTLVKALIAVLFGGFLFILLIFGIQYEKTSNFVAYSNGVLQRGGSVEQINKESEKNYNGAFTISVPDDSGTGIGDEIVYTVYEKIGLPSFTSGYPSNVLYTYSFEQKVSILGR